MAASATMQSFITSPAAQWSARSAPPRLARAPPRYLVVKSSIQEALKNSTSPPKKSTKLSDILAFGGAAPERINGRLAMLGFVSAIAVELSSGQDVFAQIANGGVPLFIAASVAISFASLVPLIKGISVQSRSDGLMTSDAEMWNGRFAMLGLVALALTEYVKGGALV